MTRIGIIVKKTEQIIIHKNGNKTRAIKTDFADIMQFWNDHKCDQMELQDIEYEDQEAEREERKQIKDDYRTHYWGE